MVGGYFNATQRQQAVSFAMAFNAGLERMKAENYRINTCIASAIVCLEKLGYPNEDFERFAIKVAHDIYDLEAMAEKTPAATLSSLIETVIEYSKASL